jgi:hypothetical protein
VRGRKREGRGISPPTPRREIENHPHHDVFWDLPEDHRYHCVFGEGSLYYQIYFDVCLYTLDPAEGERHRKSPWAMRDYLFRQTSGLFLVIPTDDVGNERHFVGVDMNHRRISDSADEFAMFLSHESLSRCAGGHSTCTGLADISKLYRIAAGLKKQVRGFS